VPLDVPGGGPQHGRIVPKLAEAAVAAEAQQLAHATGAVVVVDVHGRGPAADGAQPALRLGHRVGLLGRDAVPTLQVVGA
jgi:hypothetical protein